MALAITTLDIPHFTRFVGTAPGTTTLHISPSGKVDLMGLRKWWNPYIDIPTLRGPSLLGGLGASATRWDLFALALGLSFAGAIGYSMYKRK